MSWFLALANFSGKNTPTMADFKLLMWTQSWEEMLTVGSHKPGRADSGTPVGRNISCLPKRPANLLPREFFSSTEATWICISCKSKLRTKVIVLINDWGVVWGVTSLYVYNKHIPQGSSTVLVCVQAWDIQWRILRAEQQWESHSSLVDSGSLETGL